MAISSAPTRSAANDCANSASSSIAMATARNAPPSGKLRVRIDSLVVLLV